MNGEELVFLYQMKEGHTSSSYAFNIALNVGLPQAIVRRAKQVYDKFSICVAFENLSEVSTANLVYKFYNILLKGKSYLAR